MKTLDRLDVTREGDEFASRLRRARSCTIRCARWWARWCWSAGTWSAADSPACLRRATAGLRAGRAARGALSGAGGLLMLSRRGLLALPLLATAARAQTYPAGQVRVIVPFPPGGATDVLGRVLASGLQTTLGPDRHLGVPAGCCGRHRHTAGDRRASRRRDAADGIHRRDPVAREQRAQHRSTSRASSAPSR